MRVEVDSSEAHGLSSLMQKEDPGGGARVPDGVKGWGAAGPCGTIQRHQPLSGSALAQPAGGATPWVPEGTSYWEFGTDQRPGPKAESDYAARLSSIEATERAHSTFVFVTGRNPHPRRPKFGWPIDFCHDFQPVVSPNATGARNCQCFRHASSSGLQRQRCR
jgi:hypothetical protein